MATQLHPYKRHARGVSLVELMVGLVIGLVAILVVMQVFQLSEGARRTTVGGDDAQISGALSLTGLQREIRHAGYGSSAFPIIGCAITLPGGWTIPAMAPVTINPPGLPPGDANTDTLLVAYGSGAGSPEGDLVAAQPAQPIYSVATPTSFAPNDLIVAAVTPRPAPCNLTLERVTAVVAPSPPNVSVATGVAGMVNGTLYNFGTAPQFLAYAVRGGSLTTCDYMANDCGNAANAANPAVWVPVGNGIVSLRAEYGRDTTVPTMDAVVDVYDQNTPVNACGWARVTAMRLAIVARSGEVSRDNVTPVAPEWAASDATPINLTANADWQRLRYKTFETTVPVRNMAWQGVQTGC